MRAELSRIIAANARRVERSKDHKERKRVIKKVIAKSWKLINDRSRRGYNETTVNAYESTCYSFRQLLTKEEQVKVLRLFKKKGYKAEFSTDKIHSGFLYLNLKWEDPE